MRWLLAIGLLAGCSALPGDPDFLREPRGFPGDGASATGTVPPPECVAPECWSAAAPDFRIDLTPDGAGGVNHLAWYGGGWEIEHTGGSAFVDAPAAVMHYDDAGVLDRWEPFQFAQSPLGMDATGDGGLLVVASQQAELFGVPIEGPGAVVKVDADWQFQWQLHTAGGGNPPLMDAWGMPDGGALILQKNQRPILDADGEERLGYGDGTVATSSGLLRVDADGETLWTRRLHVVADVSVAPDGGLLLYLSPDYGADLPLWDGTLLPQEGPDGLAAGGWLLRLDPDGDVQWVTAIAWSGLNFNGAFPVATSDGGGWAVGNWFRPFGGGGGDMAIAVGELSAPLPEYGAYAQNSAVVRLGPDGSALSLDIPETAVSWGAGEYATHEAFGVARDVDDSLLLSGRMMAFTIPLNDVLPFDSGLTRIGGSSMRHSGDYLARIDANGGAAWMLSHNVLGETTPSLVVTDGRYLFAEKIGPDLDGTPAGPGGPLVRIPLPEPE